MCGGNSAPTYSSITLTVHPFIFSSPVSRQRSHPTNTASAADETPAAAAAALAERASPAAFARAFAQAASGAATGGRGNSGGGVGGKGRGAGGGREERYYRDGDETSRPAASALTEAQV